MTETEKKNRYRWAGILAFLIIIVIGLYRFGPDIPLVNKLPLFSEPHEHSLRPVFDEEGDIEYWTCTMHPSVRMKDPGKCPICGMDTVPVKSEPPEEETTEDSESMAEMKGHDHSAMGVRKSSQGDSGKSVFQVSPDRQQLIGVKTSEVLTRNLDKEIRTVGTVVLDESKIYNVQTRITGWIEKVYADFTWQHVRAGDPLFSIYSPELVSAQEEYLLALKSKDILSDSQFSDISGGARSLLKASRKRLKLWGVTDAQIREIENKGASIESLVIYSPVTGHVAEKNAYENMFVEPNTLLYKIADHTTAWVQVDIYENEISQVKLGQPAVMTLQSYPGEEFKGEVTFIWPHLDHESRTVKVRLEFPNPDLKLLPQMYANVDLLIPLGEMLTVPESAVLRTGKKDLVFVDLGKGNMEIKRVQLGQKAGGYYEVLRGLREGEKVVTRANFLIDSESQVQAAVATWGDEDTTKREDLERELPREKEPGTQEQNEAQTK